MSSTAPVTDLLAEVVASDNCSAITLGQSPPAGTPVGVGATSIVVTGTDQTGSSATCATLFTVRDALAPTIACPANIVSNAATGLCGAIVTFAPSANDACSSATVICSPPSGSTFSVGTNTVTCTAGDASGNTASCSFTVRVVDNQPPSITCPAAQVKNTTKCSVPVTYPNPTVTDNCSSASVSCSPASGSTFPIGTNTVSCTASDASGNTVSCSFSVIVHKTGGKPCR